MPREYDFFLPKIYTLSTLGDSVFRVRYYYITHLLSSQDQFNWRSVKLYNELNKIGGF